MNTMCAETGAEGADMSNSMYPVITISRQYGAGGTSIAKSLSELLDIPWYDKDFMLKTAERSGYTLEEIKASGENVSPWGRLITNLLNPVIYESSSDAIQRVQEEVILELSKSPCIIVGRCANVVLKRAQVPCLSVFLHADIEKRMERAAQLKENGDLDLKAFVNRIDTHREKYYKTYTGLEQGDYRENDLCIDTGITGYDLAAEIIAKMARHMAE